MAGRNSGHSNAARTRANGPPQLQRSAKQPTTHISPSGKHTVVKPPARKPTVGGTGAPAPLPGSKGSKGSGGGQGAPPAATPVAPFLTPTQQLALNGWNTKYSNDLATLTQKDTDALAQYNQGASSDTLRNSTQVDMTNQGMAARGMFTSSIRDGALNDLASSLQQQLNILQTNENSILLTDQTSRNSLAGDNASQQGYYNGLAVQNAQSVTPVPPPPGNTPPPGGNPNQPHTVPGQTPPGGTRPPSLASGVNQPSTHIPAGGTGGNAGIRGTRPNGSTPKPVTGGTGFMPPGLGTKGAAQLRMGGGGIRSGVVNGGG